MSNEKRKQPEVVNIPVNLHVPENLQSHYVHNVIVQPGQEEDEQEWDALFNAPNLRRKLHRLAAEARRQFAAGETEEGGFAVE